MDAAAPTIRPAMPGDADGIGLVHVRSWQAAYRGLFPQDYLDGLDPVRRAEGWRHHLAARPDTPGCLLVAETSRGIAGFASAGPCRDGDAKADGELRAIYVLPAQWGRGLGRALISAALGVLAGAGFTQARLWVVRGNERARRFYEAGGWAPDGAAKTDDRLGFPIAEVRYRRQLP